MRIMKICVNFNVQHSFIKVIKSAQQGHKATGLKEPISP